MRSLAPLLRYDFALVAEMAGEAKRFRASKPTCYSSAEARARRR